MQDLVQDWELIFPPNNAKPFWRNKKTSISTYDTPPIMKSQPIQYGHLDYFNSCLENSSALAQIERGVHNVSTNADFTIIFKKPFKSAPVVYLTGQGVRNHSVACLTKPPTTTSFGARLIHIDGSWETGNVHWMAMEPS